MEKTTLKETLRNLAQDGANRTKIGRLREAFEDIRAAQLAGVSNAKIVDALNAEHGLGLSLKTFETMLYRLRKEASATSERKTVPPAPSRPVPSSGPARRPAAPAVPESDPPAPDPAADGESDLRKRGEAVADRYMTGAASNPLLKKKTRPKEAQ